MRKLLILLLAVTLLAGCGSGGTGSEEVAGKQRIKINKEFKINNFTVVLQSVTVEDDTIEIPIKWNHWASNEKIHFSVLAFPAVYQGEQHLELIGGEDSMYKKVDKGIDSMVELKYKMIDQQTPVTIKIIATTDEMEEETVIVDIAQ